MAKLAAVLRTFGAAYLRTHALSPTQARAWRAIVACRTAALGGQRLRCQACGQERNVFHSCRNRHCAQCQTRTKEAWAAARLSELLPVPYAHLVFTLPHALNPLAGAHPRWVYETLFACVAHTLSEFAANRRWLGGTIALTLVLHTWTQDLRRHVHVHALASCGGLDEHGRWVRPPRAAQFLFPVHALSAVFRAKFLAVMDQGRAGAPLDRDPQAARWNERRQALLATPWVVYAKTPPGGPAQVLEYLSRYTHRTAICEERILSIDAEQVKLRVRADGNGGKRLVRLDGVQFIERFVQHVLPRGFKRIRHYGLLAPAHKSTMPASARSALQAPPPQPQTIESAQAFMRRVARIEILRCPHCRDGQFQPLQAIAPRPGASVPRSAPCRSPP